jgi:flagellar biosynthesis protein FliQ
MTLVLVALMPWFLGQLVEYLTTIIKSLPNLTA